MRTVSSSLFHRILLPENANAELYPTIMYLHGRGADEEDLLGLSGSFNPRFLSIAVRAPFQWEFGGYTWYEAQDLGNPEPLMFRESYEKLCRFLDDAINNYPVDPNKIFLLGFSMGTVMAYACMLTMPARFAGAIANSGYLAENTHLAYSWEAMTDRNIFIGHGSLDPVIPVLAARRAHSLFTQSKARVTYREYMMGHEISQESLHDMSMWLDDRMITDN